MGSLSNKDFPELDPRTDDSQNNIGPKDVHAEWIAPVEQ
jgi:hypothetical protein